MRTRAKPFWMEEQKPSAASTIPCAPGFDDFGSFPVLCCRVFLAELLLQLREAKVKQRILIVS